MVLDLWQKLVAGKKPWWNNDRVTVVDRHKFCRKDRGAYCVLCVICMEYVHLHSSAREGLEKP